MGLTVGSGQTVQEANHLPWPLSLGSKTTESVAGDEPRRGEMNQEWEEEGQRGRERRREGGGADSRAGRGALKTSATQGLRLMLIPGPRGSSLLPPQGPSSHPPPAQLLPSTRPGQRGGGEVRADGPS